MRQFLTLSLLFGLFLPLFGQNVAPNFWTPVKPESISLPPSAERKINPSQIHTFQLDYASLKSALTQAPMEFTAAARQQPVMLSLPLADGSLRNFRVWESPVMAPELMTKFPAIRTYAGSADDDSGLTVRLGVDYNGFYAYIFNQQGNAQIVRPYSDGTSDFYMTYRQEDLSGGQDAQFHCGVNSNDVPLNPTAASATPDQTVTERGAAPVTLRKYRLAVVTQGEYAQFHGGTKPLVMSAIVQAVNYIVNIQERDWAVRLELIPNNDTLIFLDPATDPYMGGGLIPNWIGDNPGAINPRVGINNYDIGHLFSRVNNPTGIYVAGQANLASVCSQFEKAIAGSSLPEPIGEDFYLIVAHEMGHQFSANHTFNSCPSSAGQTSGQTAYEPGGGSTIMGYTVCDPDNIGGGRGDYFHVINLIEVTNFLTQGGGNTCGEAIVTDNNTPEVSIPLTDGFFIPIGTPFTLTGNVTDQDGDDLSYCWEQFDLGPTSSLGQPTGDAPIFRSYPPADDPSRTFPRLNNIVFNNLNNEEVLPTYSRNLTFKLTARDNHPGAGGVTSAEVKFKATDKAGPFVVKYPNSSAVTWYVGEYQTVEWDVANTDKDPVNCQKVDILLSTNNGLGYQVVLASGVPNTGRYCIQVPNNTTNNARIRVQATENVFFDISNVGFKLLQPVAPDFSFCAGPATKLACAPTSASMEISTNAVSGFSDPITLTAIGLPAGATATFSPNPVMPGETSTVTVDFSDQAPEGSFTLTVEGTAASSTRSFGLPFEVVQNDFSTMAHQTPVYGAQSVDLAPWLRWNGAADADKYGIQVATSPSFEQSVLLYTNDNLTLDSFKIPALLAEGQVIYWRVRPINDCGPGPWLEPFVFVTKVQNCATLVATDLPKNISANGTPTVESKITVTGAGTSLADVNVKKVQGNHDFMRDLEVRLISPAGTNILLFKDKCGSYSGGFNIGFDDSGNGTFACPPPQNGTFAKPTDPLSTLNGQDANGVWTLRVKDNEFSSGGQVAGFELQLCSGVSLNAPFIVNNNPLQLPGGTNEVIGENLLKVEDPNNSPGQLLFTIVTIPRNGILSITGAPFQPGAQFTQDDINNGLLRYYDYGWNLGNDDFRFTVTDGEGGLVSGTFSIQPSTVSTKEPLGSIAFGLAPNPAGESVRLYVTEALDTDSRVTLFNTSGQQLRSWSLGSGSTTLLLDIADLPQGVYAVAVENEKGRGVKKVVIQH